MLKYTIKCPWFRMEEKIRQFLTKTLENIFKFYFETMVLSIGFTWNWIHNLRNFGIIKGNKYLKIWLVNMVFKSTFSLKKLNEIDLCEVIRQISLYIQRKESK